MNLTRADRSNLPDVFAYVRDEAVRLGAHVIESEVIGLVPAQHSRDARREHPLGWVQGAADHRVLVGPALALGQRRAAPF